MFTKLVLTNDLQLFNLKVHMATLKYNSGLGESFYMFREAMWRASGRVGMGNTDIFQGPQWRTNNSKARNLLRKET